MSDDSEIEGIIASAIQAANVTAPTIDLGISGPRIAAEAVAAGSESRGGRVKIEVLVQDSGLAA